ncbi:aminotransferase-like domain-containing protein [Streptomyces sp. NPDC054854]
MTASLTASGAVHAATPGGPSRAGFRLDTSSLHASVTDAALTSMTLLNDIAGRYPQAVSFAAGRPYEGFYDTGSLPRQLRAFEEYLERDVGLGPEEIRRTLFQYGRTKGFIHELIARHLKLDEALTVDPESIVVTTGAQEAMVLVLRALGRDHKDVVLAAVPAYVGFLGATRLVDVDVRAVREGPGGIDLDDLAEQIRRARQQGLRPRACYVVPDFANPSGASMSLEDRRRLVDLAEREDILLLEDNPYSFFHAGAPRLPTLKALDRARRVVYFGSFSKTAYAGARIGYVIADQPVTEDGSGAMLFADQLARLKSMLTLNTSTVAQAAIGGFLVENGCSLERATRSVAAVYRRNLRAVLDGLEERFGSRSGFQPDGAVSWNTPSGGMFVVVTLPFVADDMMLERSGGAFGVLWTPMHHFYGGKAGFHQIRLSFSVLSPERVAEGLDRLAAFVADGLRTGVGGLARGR